MNKRDEKTRRGFQTQSPPVPLPKSAATPSKRQGAAAVRTQREAQRGPRAQGAQPRAAPAAQPSPPGNPGPLSASAPPGRGEAGLQEGTRAQPAGAPRTACHPSARSPRALLSGGPQRHEAAVHRPLPGARPAEPLEELPAVQPGFSHGRGVCSAGPDGKIRAGWQGRESAVAPRGRPPCSGCSQGVQPVPGAECARRGLAARGAVPTRLQEPPEAGGAWGQEAAPRAAAAASPATCTDLEKQSAGPAAARGPGPGQPSSAAPRDLAAILGCALHPATRAPHGVSAGEGSRGAGAGAVRWLPARCAGTGEASGLCSSSLGPRYCGETSPNRGSEI